ncbi:MAG: M1 family metallopeptidase [Acidobacteria bacterium]|nr:M1 family metallopeptidase [Acidobacteriota bacterium]MCA1609832.1 M1 family metallopeptidase [Acidobacteriota bacterium]
MPDAERRPPPWNRVAENGGGCRRAAGLLLLCAAMACASATGPRGRGPGGDPAPSASVRSQGPDPHSYSNPARVRVRHVALEIDVRFGSRSLAGTAVLSFESRDSGPGPLLLDTRDLTILSAETAAGRGPFTPARFLLGPSDPILGAPLSIDLPSGATRARIRYETSPRASALQWLLPPQTAGKRHPFLFTQSQAIHARSWIPLQDSPGVRQTWSASVRVPAGLTALMSAARLDRGSDGAFRFEMTSPVPSYLIALAAGDLAFAALGPRAGVWSEPSVVSKAAWEFADTEAMIEAAEALFGPYRWERYELLVLPPSFPYGGMENPRLTFATPTLLAGDRSLVDVVAHELAHSWSGNLVTNATWSDFWLNEGFTTYCERRIVERVFGPKRSEMEWVLGRQTLEGLSLSLEPGDLMLRPEVAGRDPDAVLSEVAYEKGALLLLTIERAVGRERFDPFLRGWFDAHAFRSATTADFLSDLDQRLFAGARPPGLDLDSWLNSPAIPPEAAAVSSSAFADVDALRVAWLAGSRAAESLPAKTWSTLEWLRFLRNLPRDLPLAKSSELDRAFHLSEALNSEIAFQWLLLSIESGYPGTQARLDSFLTSIGRRKYLKPLYEALAKTPAGRERAVSLYRRARPGYHPIAVETVDRILSWKPSENESDR